MATTTEEMAMTETSGRKQKPRAHLFRPGQSGNPSGRPKGVGLTGRLRKAISAEAVDIVAALVKKAKAGDVQAARVLLDRIVPALKAEAMPVVIPGLVKAGSLTERAESALQAIGNGDVAPDTGASLVAAVGALARLKELDDIEARIRALEERNDEHQAD